MLQAHAARALGRPPALLIDGVTPSVMPELSPLDQMPVRMAPINALLDQAPPEVRKRLLVDFVSLLQTPTYG
jgi:hypothetical protein